MALDLLLAALGLVILLLAGDALVRGAVNMSLRIGIPAMIVSLTIVAEWRKAETGVGASIALGSQKWSGIWADLAAR